MGKSERSLYCQGNKLHRHRPRPKELSVATSTVKVFSGGYVFVLTGSKWCGIWPTARYVRGTMGVPGYPGYVRVGGKPVKKKTAPKSDTMARHIAAVETNLFGQLLSLVEHCCVTKYEDGDPREPGWFTVKTQGAAWTVQVKDPDSGNSFATCAETLDKALETAALLLACDEAPWAPDAFLRRGKKK